MISDDPRRIPILEAERDALRAETLFQGATDKLRLEMREAADQIREGITGTCRVYGGMPPCPDADDSCRTLCAPARRLLGGPDEENDAILTPINDAILTPENNAVPDV